MNNKKLKDLRKGDRIWYWYFTCTTPIYVESAKREGSLMRLTVKWDDAEFECFGHALGFTCVGYSKAFREDMMFTCSYDVAHENGKRRQRIKDLEPKLKELLEHINEI